MIGTTGTGVGAAPGGPQVVGLDADSGAVEWHVHTIAQPGNPGGESWNGVPVEKRSGASVWTTGSYDRPLGLAFFGTGNTYDTGPLLPQSTSRASPTPRSIRIRRWPSIPTAARSSGRSSTLRTISGTSTRRSNGS